jgi:hypothetical protein
VPSFCFFFGVNGVSTPSLLNQLRP